MMRFVMILPVSRRKGTVCSRWVQLSGSPPFPINRHVLAHSVDNFPPNCRKRKRLIDVLSCGSKCEASVARRICLMCIDRCTDLALRVSLSKQIPFLGAFNML
jgi:hypothetical protein